MKTYLITDTHFGHDAMIEYCGRPRHHSDLILNNLAKMLKPKDILIHLGDICIGEDNLWHIKLVGSTPGVKRILIKGNHDNKSNSWYYDHGWDYVCTSSVDFLYGKGIVFSHIPVNPMIGDMNIHGHFHNNSHRMDAETIKYYDPKYHKKLAVEETGYKPVELDTFINLNSIPSPSGDVSNSQTVAQPHREGSDIREEGSVS